MKISFKILGGYFAISLLLIIMGVLVIRTSYLLNPVIKELDNEVNNLNSAITISDLTDNIVFLRSQLRFAVTQFYITNDPSYVEKYAHTESQLERVYNKIINHLTSEDNRKIFQNLKSSTDKLGQFEMSFIASFQEDQSAAFELLSQDMEYQRLNKSISKFINSYSYSKKIESDDVFSRLTAIANALQVSKKEINWQSQITLFLLVFVCIASILVGVIVSRSISNPIIKLRDKVGQIGKGEIVFIEETASRDETGDLINAFAKMTKEIRQSQEQLRESEEENRSIVTNAMDGIITFDKTGTIQSFNSAAEKDFYYKEEEIIGKNIKLLMPEPYPSEHDGYIQNYLNTGVARIIGVPREVPGQRKDGSIFPLEISISKMRKEGQQMFIGIARDITERKKAEAQLEQTTEQLRTLFAQQESLREEERERIARDVHDNLGQILMTLKFDLSDLLEKIHPDMKELEEKTRLIIRTVDSTIDSVQKILIEMRPQILDIMGLSPAVEWQALEFQNRTGIVCEIRVSLENIELDKKKSLVLFRIFQEALRNVGRHAKADKVVVKLEESENYLLEIQDNGCGMDSDKINNVKSLGLLGIRERARSLGGEAVISSIPGKGTTVLVNLPK